MKNKWLAYGGITIVTVILLLITYIIFIRIHYQKLLEQSRHEADKKPKDGVTPEVEGKAACVLF